jgi:hypothetical protein
MAALEIREDVVVVEITEIQWNAAAATHQCMH